MSIIFKRVLENKTGGHADKAGLPKSEKHVFNMVFNLNMQAHIKVAEHRAYKVTVAAYHHGCAAPKFAADENQERHEVIRTVSWSAGATGPQIMRTVPGTL